MERSVILQTIILCGSIACVFFLPLSISLKTIFLISTVIAVIILDPQASFMVYKQPWAIISVCLFLLIVIGYLWTPAPWSIAHSLIHKYTKLLYIPLLALAFKCMKHRQYALHAYLFAMLLTVAACVLKKIGFIAWVGDPGDPGSIIYNHIVTGFFVALAAYFSALLALKSQDKVRNAYSMLAFIFTIDTLFI